MGEVTIGAARSPRHIWEILIDLVDAEIITRDDARTIVMVRQDAQRNALLELSMMVNDARHAGHDGVPLDGIERLLHVSQIHGLE